MRKQEPSESQTDQYGRKKFQLGSRDAQFQPPKPTEMHPDHISPDKISSKNSADIKPAEKRRLLQTTVDREEFNADQLLGKEITITAQTEEDKQSVFYCKTCKVQLKDSQAFYDHINGKKHNQMLGMSMVVERVTLDKVKEKLAGLKRKAERPIESIEDIERRLDEQEREEHERKSRKRQKTHQEELIEQERIIEELENGQDGEGIEPEEDLSAFGLPMNFGTTKRKK